MNRPTRWLAVTLAFVLSACVVDDRTNDPESAATSALIANRNLDILFMIDDSASMLLSQANLLANFPTFMDVLKNLPGGLPNIHVAVVSADMGATPDGSTPGCEAGRGDNGSFQFMPRGSCTASTLAPGATYISNVGGQANYTAADISTVFTCIAALGEAGCGYEQPFASILRALGADGAPAPVENQGFLRTDALLASVMVTNEDDCSAGPGIGVGFYESTNYLVLNSELGLANFRCAEFGHLCSGARPPRMAPNGQLGDTVTLENCTSSECDGLLTPVGEFVARIKALKASPANEIVVAAIAGPTAPYQVRWRAPLVEDTSCGQASCPWPLIEHSCTAVDNSFADPGIRVAQAIGAFGANGFYSSICESNFAPALQQVASRIGTLLAAGGGIGGSGGTIPTCATTGFGGGGGAVGSGGGTGAAGATGGAGAAGGAGATGGGGATGGAGTTGGAGNPADSGGCGCQTSGTVAGRSWLAVAIMALLARRRCRRAV